MPRLVGKKNNSILYAGLGLVAVAIGAIALEYFGTIDYIPDFGKNTKVDRTSVNQPSRINRSVN